jgi:hypothetical protein
VAAFTVGSALKFAARFTGYDNHDRTRGATTCHR